MDSEYEDFKAAVLRLTGINLSLYKEKQMKRRIGTLITRKGYGGYSDYASVLEQKPEELEYFLDYITINVTEFFRTPDHWQSFEEDVLGQLSEISDRKLKIWSCACSTGEEPYSVVMSLIQYLPHDRFEVCATDIDDRVLTQAEEGIFTDTAMATVPENMKQRYFTHLTNGWKISDEIKSCVKFGKLDLLKYDYPDDIDLIICRNVLIYFTEEAKNSIYYRFRESLRDGGYLFTGNTEQIIQYRNFGYTRVKNFIYRKSNDRMVDLNHER